MPKAATYQCPHCGGVVSYHAETGLLTCEFCDNTFQEGELEAKIPLSEATVEKKETSHATSVSDFLERAPWEVSEDGSVNAVTYSCPSCGAAVVADQSTISTDCPYCGNNMLVSGIANTSNIPEKILPFSITKEQAEQRMREHFEHKWYLSRQFDASLEHMRGVYVPYHLYDMHTQGWAHYLGYNEVSDSDGDTTKYYIAVTRAGHASFEKIPIDGSSKMPDGHMDAIAPFHFEDMVDFSARYVAGYLTEVADEDAEQCLPKAETLARTSFEDGLRADARRERGIDGIDSVEAHETEVGCDGVSSCVLPVWLMHCTWDENEMLFAVNGETGKCVGDLPIDTKRRIATVVSLALGLLAAIIFIYFTMIKGSEDSYKFLIGGIVLGAVVTFAVDAHFRGQMHTAVEASNADMSFDSEGLVVTDRWRSKRQYLSRSKARSQLPPAPTHYAEA